MRGRLPSGPDTSSNSKARRPLRNASPTQTPTRIRRTLERRPTRQPHHRTRPHPRPSRRASEPGTTHPQAMACRLLSKGQAGSPSGPASRPRLVHERNEVIELLDELGPGTGVPTLHTCFPSMARAELDDILKRYRSLWSLRLAWRPFDTRIEPRHNPHRSLWSLRLAWRPSCSENG
jgi:hypothetical protein